ncbi:MAG: zinc ABC transporter substrate-binding protein [Rikenellaceae bacterium]|nr:zinc ABC transporter substrate-binding protein [Rikenellaceae bacterium]
MRKIVTILCALLAVACGGTNAPTDNRPTITVSIAPLKSLTEAIVGDGVRVEVLIPAGASPETFEPTPRQITAMADSRAVYTVGLIEFERSLTARTGIATTPLCEGIELIGGHYHNGHNHGADPHIWTSPRELRVMASNLHSHLRTIFPDSTHYDARYAQLDSTLVELDHYVASCWVMTDRDYFIIYHPALTYYARAYGIEQVAIEQEGREPSARSLTALIERARRDSVRTIFYQRPYPASVVATVAESIGAEAVEFDPLAEDVRGMIRSITVKMALE